MKTSLTTQSMAPSYLIQSLLRRAGKSINLHPSSTFLHQTASSILIPSHSTLMIWNNVCTCLMTFIYLFSLQDCRLPEGRDSVMLLISPGHSTAPGTCGGAHWTLLNKWINKCSLLPSVVARTKLPQRKGWKNKAGLFKNRVYKYAILISKESWLSRNLKMVN